MSTPVATVTRLAAEIVRPAKELAAALEQKGTAPTPEELAAVRYACIAADVELDALEIALDNARDVLSDIETAADEMEGDE